MAVLCPDHHTMDLCARVLKGRRLPHQVRKRSGDYKPTEDNIRIMTMHVSKGLEFPVVALMGIGRMESKEPNADAARLFYVAATRASEKLIITSSGSGALSDRLEATAT
jgi:ATP-dependent exoDNAse (exonuclease V) beta subunit